MKNIVKTILVVIGALLIAAGVLVALRNFADWRTGLKAEKNTGSFLSNVNKFVNEKVSLEEFTDIEASVHSASFKIEVGNENKLTYALPEELVPAVKVKSGKLYIEVPKDSSSIFNIAAFIGEKPEITLTIKDADKVREIDLHSSSGSMELSDFNANGKITANSGGVDITDMNFNQLELKVDAGSCRIENCDFEDYTLDHASGSSKYLNCTFTNAQVESSSGSMNFEDCTCENLKCKRSSGGFDSNNCRFDNIDMKVSSGSTRLELLGNADDYDLDIDASSGSVSVDGQSYKDGCTIDRGRDKLVKIHSSSGSITVDFR